MDLFREQRIAPQGYNSTFYTNLVKSLIIQEPELQRLVGSYILVEELDTVGLLKETNGRDMLLEPVAEFAIDSANNICCQALTKQPDIIVSALFNGTRSNFPLGESLNECQSIHSSYPVNITITSKTAGSLVAFHPDDPDLDRLIQNAVSTNPEIKSISDLAALTDWIHKHVPYKDIELRGEFRQLLLPLGKLIREHGAVCRNILAVEIAVLGYMGFIATPLHVYRPEEGSGHLYLKVNLNESEPDLNYHTDPTWNLCGTYEEIIAKLNNNGTTTDYHKEPITCIFEPNWY